MSFIHVELAEGSMRGGITSVSLHYHVIGKLYMCTRFSNILGFTFLLLTQAGLPSFVATSLLALDLLQPSLLSSLAFTNLNHLSLNLSLVRGEDRQLRIVLMASDQRKIQRKIIKICLLNVCMSGSKPNASKEKRDCSCPSQQPFPLPALLSQTMLSSAPEEHKTPLLKNILDIKGYNATVPFLREVCEVARLSPSRYGSFHIELEALLSMVWGKRPEEENVVGRGAAAVCLLLAGVWLAS